MVSVKEKEQLLSLYCGCRPYFGELHDHSRSGGTADGKSPLSEWVQDMKTLKMDFAAILDHRQVRHMYLPEWKDGLFIPGTEPGTTIVGGEHGDLHIHYNILLPNRFALQQLLHQFPEYKFTGGIEGHFVYPTFTREHFCELVDAVKALGGFVVHPHPMQLTKVEDPLDYWFRDGMGIEVFYVSADSEYTKEDYPLWEKLLAAGKRVFACAGGDEHARASDKALTTIYAEDCAAAAYLGHLRTGDFTCGAVGIRMCVGDTVTGGTCAFDGQRLIVCVGDFHDSVKFAGHEYRLDILDDKGVVYSRAISCDDDSFAAIDTGDAAFYRAEVFDVTRDLRIAVGNPIWNKK